MWFSGFLFSCFVSHSWGIPMMKITGLSHLFKWENLHNWWLTKYFFAPLYIHTHTHTHTYIYIYIKLARNQQKIKPKTWPGNVSVRSAHACEKEWESVGLYICLWCCRNVLASGYLFLSLSPQLTTFTSGQRPSERQRNSQQERPSYSKHFSLDVKAGTYVP